MFFKHFVSKSQLPGFYISETLVENWLMAFLYVPNHNLKPAEPKTVHEIVFFRFMQKHLPCSRGIHLQQSFKFVGKKCYRQWVFTKWVCMNWCNTLNIYKFFWNFQNTSEVYLGPSQIFMGSFISYVQKTYRKTNISCILRARPLVIIFARAVRFRSEIFSEENSISYFFTGFSGDCENF